VSDNIEELLREVRAAQAYGASRAEKIAFLRRHKWRRVTDGKGQRWQSPDHTFTGTIDQCYQRQLSM
jgi:hypothetical protein